MALLEKQTMSTAGEKVVQFVQDLPQLHSSDLVMKIGALLLGGASASAGKTRHNVDERGSELSLLTFPPKSPERPFVDIVAVVDPVSTGAQKLAPLLLVLQEVCPVHSRAYIPFPLFDCISHTKFEFLLS